MSAQRFSTAELLFRAAQEMGLHPSWITPRGLFAIVVDGHERYVNFARSPLNSHTSISLTKDKHLTRLILQRHHLPNIPFVQPRSQAEAALFLDKHSVVIAKPVGGSGARNIQVITAASQFRPLDITKYILEEYIAGQELRYLILDGEVVGVHRSEYGTSVQENRPLERISYPRSAWDSELVSLTIDVARVLDLRFAAIDYIIDPSGRAYILEVNSKPGLKWFHAPTSGPAIDVARQFLRATYRISNPPAAIGTMHHTADRRAFMFN